MRTAQLKINGKTVEGVLMSGGFGAQVYSVSGVKGVVLKTGRSTHVIHEDTPAFKTVMRFMNMKYQPLNEHDAILVEFRGLVKELKGEEQEMAKVKNPNILTRQAHKKSKPYSEMSENELWDKKLHNLELMKSYPSNSNLYKSASKHFSEISRELKKFPMGEGSPSQEIPKRLKKRNPSKPFSEMTREELEAEKRAALSLLKTFTRGSALYEDTMRDLGKINRELRTMGEPSALSEFAKRRNPAKPKHLKLWERPSNYAGPDWSDYYVLFVKSRDDDSYNLLNISNFDVALDRLGGESEDNGVLVIRDSHWAVGWIEYILVHKDSKKVKIAEEIMEAYHQYPVLDDSHFSEVEHEAVMETYTNYKEDFLKELLAYVGDERDVSELKGKELEEADIILQYVIEHVASGSGAENAWISEREIKHWIHGQHEYFYDKKNRWFKKLMKAEGL